MKNNVEKNVIVKNLFKLISIFLITFNLLYANSLGELRSLLGDENVPSKEIDIQNSEKPLDEEVFKEDKNIEYNSLLEAPSDYYTINITTTNGIEEAKNYLIDNNFNISGIYIYSFGVEKKSAKIIYGFFKSLDEAKTVIDSLPESINKNKPYIDNIKKHQKLYLKYN